MNRLTVYSHAKINLYLQVLNKRPDNYHNLKTIFERISLHDKISLKVRLKDKEIKIICDSPDVPCGRTNLTYKSAKLLQDSMGIRRGVDIKIKKNIPVAAGLGGGSSNAAAVLFALNKLWKLNLTTKELVSFARRIGADVAFFLYDCAFAKAVSRGDKITPLKFNKKVRFWHVLVVPRIKVSTPHIYRMWDKFLARQKGKLTNTKASATILILGLRKNNPNLRSSILFNDLEGCAFKLHPEILRVKKSLVSLGLDSVLMSGSGAAVFAIVSSRKEAISIAKQLKKLKANWRVFVARTK